MLFSSSSWNKVSSASKYFCVALGSGRVFAFGFNGFFLVSAVYSEVSINFTHKKTYNFAEIVGIKVTHISNMGNYLCNSILLEFNFMPSNFFVNFTQKEASYCYEASNLNSLRWSRLLCFFISMNKTTILLQSNLNQINMGM